MELYPLLTNIIAVVAMITGLAIGTWYIIGLYIVHTRKQEHELPEVDLPGDLHETISGIPPVLIIFYIFVGITMLMYVLYIWLGGISY